MLLSGSHPYIELPAQPLLACHACAGSAWLEHAEGNRISPLINNYGRSQCYHGHSHLFVGFNRDHSMERLVC